jgi:hypothetical protein
MYETILHCLYNFQQGFLWQLTGMPFWKFFLRRTQAGTAFQNLFCGISITNTPPLQPNFWFLYVLEPFFKKNITDFKTVRALCIPYAVTVCKNSQISKQ